ncbi:MAG: NUDIX domain-containing protein [Lewinella sp.]|nr:NUDIX domain-containing protein [Lewinella sp.]
MASNVSISLKTRLILYDRGRILLLRQTKPNGGNYTLVGGTIEATEFARESLVREALEEAGVQIRESDLTLVHVMHKKSKSEQRITLYFKTSRWEGKLRAREKHKFKAAEWFDLDELPPNLTGTVAHVLRDYRRGILFSEQEK